jgi:hypothetical protein
MTKEKNPKDYLPLYLPFKAAINYNPEKYPNAGMYIDMITGIDLRYNKAYTSNGTSHELQQIKLLLRPLSDLTEKEAIELIALKFDHYKHYEGIRIEGESETEAGAIYFTGVTETHYNRVPCTQYFSCLNAEQYKYLLSEHHHFDLFGLIPNGLAIDNTTLQTQNNG